MTYKGPLPKFPDFLYAALEISAYAAFFTESRTRLIGSAELLRKSGYAGAAILYCVARESYCSSSTLRATNTGFPVFGFFSTRPTTRMEMAELPLRPLRPVRPPSQLVTGVV